MTVDNIRGWFNHSTVGNTLTNTHTATQHRKKHLSSSFHGNDNLHPSSGHVNFKPRGLVCMRVYTLYTGTDFGWTRQPPTPQLGMWSGLRKWRTQTHFKHRHAFFQQRSSDDKTFPRCLHMKFSDLLSALMDVAIELLGAVCQECFLRVLCGLCLDCGLLLTSLWLQIHWHVIYRNEPWRKCSKINQTDPTCTVCVSFCVCLGEMVKDKKTNKNRHRGKVWETDVLFSSLMFFNATSNHKVLKKGYKSSCRWD